ncbi:hypothetical protein PanWU01x14_083680, partial [Parasponia andersonii]
MDALWEKGSKENGSCEIEVELTTLETLMQLIDGLYHMKRLHLGNIGNNTCW